MAQLLSGSICLSDLDKSKLQTGKNGKVYLNLLISVNNEFSQYGTNAGISIQQSKEQKDAGEKKVYIGNAKTVWSDGMQAKPEKATQAANTAATKEETGDLPF